MRGKAVAFFACCVMLVVACMPAMAQYSTYCSSIFDGTNWATSWSGVGTSLDVSNYADAGATSPDGKAMKMVDNTTGASMFVTSLASQLGMPFNAGDVTAIFRVKTVDEPGVSWTTGGTQTVEVCYAVGTTGKGAALGILPDHIGLYSTSGSTLSGLETSPATYPMDNSTFHTYYLVCGNVTTGGVDCSVYRDGRLLLAGRVNSTVASALKVNSAYADLIFMGTNPNTRTGAWSYDRVAYRTGAYIPNGATDAGGSPIYTGTVWDPWSTGTITGFVYDSDTWSGIASAVVSLDDGTSVYTGIDGSYTIGVPTVGTSYNVTVSAPGYGHTTVSNISVPDATPAYQDVLISKITEDVTGVVTVAGTSTPVQGATVALSNGQSTTTAADGSFAMMADPGTHNVTVSAVGFVPRNLAPITINYATDPVTANASLAQLGAPTSTVSDDFTGDLSKWILASPDGTTETNGGTYGLFGNLYMYSLAGHGVSVGGGFMPANVDCAMTFSATASANAVGITYRQPSPCTYDDLYGQTASPGYFVKCAADGTSVSLSRSGADIATAVTSFADHNAMSHSLRVIAYGDHHWILLDGIKVIDVVDSAQMAGGYVGINRLNSDMNVYAFSASQLPDGGTSGPLATLTGTITNDATSSPIAHAAVKLANGSYGVTGSDGVYVVGVNMLDDQDVTVYAPGYTTKTVPVTSLKLGSNTLNVALTPGTPAYSTVNELSLADKGSKVAITDRLVTAGNDELTDQFDNRDWLGGFYIQDDAPGSRGIRVRYTLASQAVHEGDRVDVIGTLAQVSDNGAETTHNSEREIRPDMVAVYPGHAPDPAPVYVRNSDVGGGMFGPDEAVVGGPEPRLKGVYPSNLYGDLGSYNPARFKLAPLFNVGTLVTVCGKVTRVCSDEALPYDYYIDDGSLAYDGWLNSSLGITNTNHPAGIRIRIGKSVYDQLPVFAEGDFLVVTGIVGAISGSDLATSNGTRSVRLIRVRKPGDIQKL